MTVQQRVSREIPEGVAADMRAMSGATGTPAAFWFFLAVELLRPPGQLMADAIADFSEDASKADRAAFGRVTAWLFRNLPVSLAPKAPEGADAEKRLGDWLAIHAPGEFAAISATTREAVPSPSGDIWERRALMDGLARDSVTVARQGDPEGLVYHGHPVGHRPPVSILEPVAPDWHDTVQRLPPLRFKRTRLQPPHKPGQPALPLRRPTLRPTHARYALPGVVRGLRAPPVSWGFCCCFSGGDCCAKSRKDGKNQGVNPDFVCGTPERA